MYSNHSVRFSLDENIQSIVLLCVLLPRIRSVMYKRGGYTLFLCNIPTQISEYVQMNDIIGYFETEMFSSVKLLTVQSAMKAL